jgi:hypothetical protein
MSTRRYGKLGLAAVTAVALAATSLAGSARAADMPLKAPVALPWFLVNDTSVSFTWYPRATDPGVLGAITDRYQGEITHFDVYRYGTDFIDVTYQQYGKKDPIEGIPGARGSVEADFLVRNTLSGNAFFGPRYFTNFLTKDVSLAYGGLFVTNDNFLAPDTHQYDIGLQFSLNLPGTVNFAVYAQKETHHNSFDAVCAAQAGFGPPTGCAFTGDQTYKWAPHLELGISEPLTFLPLPITWNSFTGITFPKGTGLSQANLNAIQPTCLGNAANPCSAFSKTELFEDNRLVLDAGKLAWNKSGIWETYVGYRYWSNKFGTDHNAPVFAQASPGTSIESTAYIGTTYHFK